MRRICGPLWLTVLSLGLVSCSTDHSATTKPGATAAPNANLSGPPLVDGAAANQAEYRIRPLDTIHITVFQEPDLTQTIKVSQLGAINYPLLGSIQVSGLTVSGVEKKIVELLAQDYVVNPRVNVTVEGYSGQRVILLGQIKSPGSYEVPPEESLSLLQAIARAGGFTDIAASDRVCVVRSENGKERKFLINVTAIIKGGDKSNDIELRPGDVVSVPETLF